MHKKGFTLLEMIIAIGVFSFVIIISVSSFLNLQSAEKDIQTTVKLQNNLRFALETMARDLKTGDRYHCGFAAGISPLDCISGESSITFRNASGQTVIYRLIGSSIQKSFDGGAFSPITAADISIDDLKFYVHGAPPFPDDFQPRVIITVNASALVGGSSGGAKEFTFQTAVSQLKLQL